MKSSIDTLSGPGRSRITGTAAAVLVVILLTGCGGGKEKGASQTAAKVNKEEITVHQINFVLQQQRNIKPEQAEAATKQVLERLIDQELAVQKAEDIKLDREPRVVQTIEAAKRDILSRAYVEKVGEAAAKPTPEEVKKYYDVHPALFKDRRIYNLQELVIEAKPEQVAKLREQLAAANTVNDFVEQLKVDKVRFGANQAVRAAEQLPLSTVDMFSKMKDGQAVLVPTPNGAQVIVLAGSRSEPVDEERAKPAIEQYLFNDAKRKAAEADMKALRSAAKIEYVGKFAQGAASAVPGTGTSAAGAAPNATASSAEAEAISKGMGLSK